ncbi:alpha/beta hydrolase family protein [Roseibium sp. M-1]
MSKTSSPCRRLLLGLAAALLAFPPLTSIAAAEGSNTLPFGPGISKLTVSDERSDRPLEGDIWYPTSTPETFARTDKSKVWQMALADPEGKSAEGSFPLVVISHGMYGNTYNQAWLGSELARRGFIAAMVNHPGTSTFLRNGDQARQLWQRPVDLSRLISHLVNESTFAGSIDRDRIYAAGHSLGGMTVMMLAGAEFDTARYRSACAVETPPVVCGVLADWSIAESKADRREMETSRKDPRVSRVVSLDLGGTPVFSPESLSAIDIPVLVLGSGRADMLNQDNESRALAAALPAESVRHVELEDAGHFDFMGVCKPGAFDILKAEEPGDEIVCIKGVSEREVQHERILAEILAFLEL